jgi:outer membrane receptor protein involved in Fe transport
MGGIINIVLNQGTNRGLSGSVSGSTGTTNNHNVGINLGYGSGPWNLFGSYAFSYNNRSGSGDRYRENFIPGISPIITQSSTNDNHVPSHTLNLSADYTISKGGTISLSSVITSRNESGSSVSSTLERDSSRELTSGYRRSDESTEKNFGSDNRLGYKLVLEPGRHELSAEARYSANNGEENDAYRQNNVGTDGAVSDSLPALQNVSRPDHYRIYSLQADYTRPLWSGGRLETGYKGESEKTGGDYTSESFDYALNAFRPDVALNNSYDYTRTIHALYANVGQEIGDFGAQVGVRVEQVNTDFDLKTTGASYANDYFSAYPSAFLTYKVSDALQFKASYSKRVQRPWINALNPFITYDDPQFRRSGNPFLKPEYTDSYEFTASYYADGASLTLTPFYRRTTDALRRWEIVDSVGVSTFTFVNFDENKSYGADLIGTVRAGDWLNAFASVSAYQTVTDAGNIQEDLGSDGFAWSARANATFTLPAGVDVQASVFYRAPMVMEGGQMKSWTMMDLAVQKRILDDRGRVGLRVSDPFKLMGFGFHNSDPRYYQTYDRSWNSRGLFLTFSYSFGSQDPSQQRRSRPQQGTPSGPDMDMGG